MNGKAQRMSMAERASASGSRPDESSHRFISVGSEQDAETEREMTTRMDALTALNLPPEAMEAIFTALDNCPVVDNNIDWTLAACAALLEDPYAFED